MEHGFIDLHVHSSISDGTDTPHVLIEKAAKRQLRVIALTDHDTLEGLAEAEAAAIQYGVTCIRGCELGVMYEGREIHILGYWIPQEPSAAFMQFLAETRSSRACRNLEIINNLVSLGVHLTIDEVCQMAGEGPVGRPHIAMVMLEKGYVSSIGEAFDVYLGREGSAFVPRHLPKPEEGVAMFVAEGATVSLAHPGLYTHVPYKVLDGLLGDLKSVGLSALEVYHSAHSAACTREMLQLAQKHDLLITGGSDYHGKTKPDVTLGVAGESTHVPYCLYEKLCAVRRQHGLPV